MKTKKKTFICTRCGHTSVNTGKYGENPKKLCRNCEYESIRQYQEDIETYNEICRDNLIPL